MGSNALSEDAQAVLDWLRRDIAERGGTGRRPSKIETGLGWWDGGDGFGFGADPVKARRLPNAIRELVDAELVTLHEIDGLPGFGPYVCPRSS